MKTLRMDQIVPSWKHQVYSQGSSPAHLLWSRASFHETQGPFNGWKGEANIERWRFPALQKGREIPMYSLCIHVINSELRFGELRFKTLHRSPAKRWRKFGWIWLDSSSCPFNHELTNFIWFFKVLKHPNQLKPPKSPIKTPHGSAHKCKKNTFHVIKFQEQCSVGGYGPQKWWYGEGCGTLGTVVRYGGYSWYGTLGAVGTVRWVRWVRYGRYGGYGTLGTLGTVRWVRWVRWVRYGRYGRYGKMVRWVRYGGTHPPYPPYRTHRTHRTVPPYPPYRTHCTHSTVPTVPTVPYPPYPPYPPYRTHCTHRTVPIESVICTLPVLNHQKTCFSFLLKLDKFHDFFHIFPRKNTKTIMGPTFQNPNSRPSASRCQAKDSCAALHFLLSAIASIFFSNSWWENFGWWPAKRVEFCKVPYRHLIICRNRCLRFMNI